jgi:histidine triad (HIT) family protein
MECLFCRIAGGELPAQKRYEDELVLAFDDISPKSPVHILVISKRHITSLAEAENSDQELLGHILLTVQRLARELKLAGYKTIINTGRRGGQLIDHIHVHLLGGKTFAE